MTSSCLLLFESGRSAGVKLNAYRAVPGSRRPVDAYMMGDCGAACSEAAARAVEIVRQLAIRGGKEPRAMVYGFDLQGDRKGNRVVGASGGLAFVVAAAIQELSLDCGTVAATGVLTAADPDAPLQPVASIQAKLKTALALVPENGFILYPKANDGELDAPFRDRFSDRGIRLCAVSSAAEAVRILAGKSPDSGTRPAGDLRRFVVFLVGAVLLITAAVAFMLQSRLTEKTVPEPPPEESSLVAVPPADMAEPLADNDEPGSAANREPVPPEPVVVQQEKEPPAAPLSRADLSRTDDIAIPLEEQTTPVSPVPGTSGFD